MKISEIQDLIKFVSKSGVSEVELETKEIKLIIKTGKGLNQNVAVSLQPTAAPPVALSSSPVIPSPIIPSVQSVTVEPVKTPEKPSVQPSVPQKTQVETSEDLYVTIKSPMIGTFYRSASPDKPPFVNVGDEIVPGQTVCIIEAMKLFNEIESDVKGKIVKVLVENASPVEYDQPLFLIDPS